MRIKESFKNISISIISQIIIVFLGLVSRVIFISALGEEYLGVNGLISNVLSMLSLVEGGIGISIVYNLYKPLANKEEEKIISLVQLYKKLYVYLSGIVLVMGVVIYPLMLKLMKSEIPTLYLSVVYFIFIFKNILSYLYAHKWSLINADQRGYILGKINIVFNIIMLLLRIVVLKYTKSYIAFLLIELMVTFIQNIYNGRIVDKLYPYIKTSRKYEIEIEVKKNIIQNVKALFLHNIGSYCVNGTDNILISAFVNLKTVGLYSNYTLVISQLNSIISPIIGGINASVGNLLATENNEKSYEIFNVTYLVNFWIYSFQVIFLFNLLEPFISWIFGPELLLDKLTFLITLINMYLFGMRASINTFKVKAGMFVQDKYMPLFEAAINLVSSIILVKYFGLAGIFMGTTVSTLSIVFWNVPRLVYKNIFNKPLIEYFKRYLFYVLITLIAGTITSILCRVISYDITFISLCLKGIICCILPNVIYFCIFNKSDEFRYLKNSLKIIIDGKFKSIARKIEVKN